MKRCSEQEFLLSHGSSLWICEDDVIRLEESISGSAPSNPPSSVRRGVIQNSTIQQFFLVDTPPKRSCSSNVEVKLRRKEKEDLERNSRYEIFADLENFVRESTRGHLRCHSCSCSFTSQDDLNSHIIDNHYFPHKHFLRNRSTSTPRQLSSSSTREFIKEWRQNNKKMFVCPFCEGFYHTKKELIFHILQLHNNNRFKCDVCRKTFHEQVYLSTHTCSKGFALFNKQSHKNFDVVHAGLENVGPRSTVTAFLSTETPENMKNMRSDLRQIAPNSVSKIQEKEFSSSTGTCSIGTPLFNKPGYYSEVLSVLKKLGPMKTISNHPRPRAPNFLQEIKGEEFSSSANRANISAYSIRLEQLQNNSQDLCALKPLTSANNKTRVQKKTVDFLKSVVRKGRSITSIKEAWLDEMLTKIESKLPEDLKAEQLSYPMDDDQTVPLTPEFFEREVQKSPLSLSNSEVVDGFHKCPLCDKKFTQESNMHLHLTSKHQDLKKFVCVICAARFQWEVNLERHIMKRHNAMV